MGQRLGVVFMREDKPVLATYQHWSGYTDTAANTIIELAPAIVESSKCETTDEALDLLIGALEANLSMVLDSSFSGYITPEGQHLNANRNDGLYEVRQDLLSSFIGCAEDYVYVDLSNEVIDFQVYFWDNTIDAEEYSEEERKKLSEYDGCFDRIEFREESDIIEAMNSILLADDEQYDVDNDAIYFKIA